MNLKEASEKAFEIARKRGLNENTFEALKHCAGEVIEATKSFAEKDYYYNIEEAETSFENELADIIICVLSICGAENIDIEKAIERKMKINEERAE